MEGRCSGRIEAEQHNRNKQEERELKLKRTEDN